MSITSYFLLAVSNRTNLDLCLKHGLAGFTDSINGAWTFSEIQEDDYVSFLYGARAFNLYRVERKVAYLAAEKMPPWPSVHFKPSGKTYYFPFRLYLAPVREFHESLVKPEFAYVAENLLLRGGYRKTHFQADQTTLQAVSQLGTLSGNRPEPLKVSGPQTFVPKFTFDRSLVSPPEVFPFSEVILQAVIKRYLSQHPNLERFLESAGIGQLRPNRLETLAERAFPEGHVDVLIKESVPIGMAKQVAIEVKSGVIRAADVFQIAGYKSLIGAECLGALLIGRQASQPVAAEAGRAAVRLSVYHFEQLEPGMIYDFQELVERLRLSVL